MTQDRRQIEIKGLSFTYPPTYSGRLVQALKNVTLSIGKGEMVLLTGPSGSGKSTLLRCINGLIPHTTRGRMEGRVFVDGVDTRHTGVAELSLTVGTVFQDPDHQLFSTDTYAELAFGPEQHGWPAGRISAAIGQTAKRFRIEDLMGKPVTALSWGERQRIAIAATVVTEPEILLLDEPFSGIDLAAGGLLLETLRTLNRDCGVTVVLAEHRTDFVRSSFTREVVLLDGGIVYDGTRFPHSPVQLPVPRAGRPTANPAGCRPVLSLEDVWYRYPGTTACALESVSLDLFPGEITVITGPNGSGKSTLIRHLNGLFRPSRGRVLLNGADIVGMTVAEIARSVGVVLQHADYQLFEETIAQEIAFGPRNFGVAGDHLPGRIEAAARSMRIGHLGLETPPLSLSVGEKQRVVLAGLLAMDPPVMVMDEPTIGLDPELKRAIAGVLEALAWEGKTVVIATHDKEFAACFDDRTVALERGRIAGDSRQSGKSAPEGESC